MVSQTSVGREIARVSFPIERRRVAELSRALGDDDPVWHNAEAARAAGFDGIPTPPTVTVLLDHWRGGGVAGLAADVGADPARSRLDEVVWDYVVPVRAGDRLTARAVIADVITREASDGGTMTLVKVETEFTNQHGELAVRRTDTLVERP
jgi:acyl dehydratase